MEIRNYQNQLFNVIDRSYLLDGTSGKPVEKGLMPLNYTKKVELLSYANLPYERYNQLDNATHIGTFGKANSQPSQLPEPVINCQPRQNETASRFNYAFDKCIDRRFVDVSGQNIPNNMLRVIPNRGVQLCYQKRYVPENKPIQDLSNRIGNISATQLDKSFKISKGDFNFKASRQRLTKEELQGLGNLQFTQGTSVNDTLQSMLNTTLLNPPPPPPPAPVVAPTPVKKGRRTSSLSAAPTPAEKVGTPKTGTGRRRGRPMKERILDNARFSIEYSQGGTQTGRYIADPQV